MPGKTADSTHKTSFLLKSLHIWVLFSFAVAQPVYDLISRHAEFLVAHQSRPIDIILFIAILSLVIPLTLVVIHAAARLLSPKSGNALLGLLIIGFTTLIAMQALKQTFSFPGTVIVLLAGILGLAATLIYFRYKFLHLFLSILSPAILIFPALFLFNSPVYKLAFVKDRLPPDTPVSAETAGPSSAVSRISDPAPVVIIVFDELPVTSLMDEQQNIDPAAYPNFAALAQDAYWFRNATTVSTTTVQAVPAILSGNYPDVYRLPNTMDYPNNIFTLLGAAYELKAHEPVTQLCPSELCGGGQETALGQRMRSLVTDLGLVYLHILLPGEFTAGLPVVDQTWKDFTAGAPEYPKAGKEKSVKDMVNENKRLLSIIGEELKTDRAESFRQFVRSIDDTGKPTLYFYHCYLPHAPWIYLPSGKKHNLGLGNRGLVDAKWGDNELWINEAYQSHLFQTGFVDKLLGELVDRLKTTGLYDRSLIIITVDHGISFRRNDSRRNLTETNYMDILPIPFLIKVPGQHEGKVSDRNVETIDILPTVADVLNISLPWEVDGQSVLDPSLPEREEKVIFTVFKSDAERRKVYGPRVDAKLETLKHKICLFGDGKNLEGLPAVGCRSKLIGKQVQGIQQGDVFDVGVEVDNPLLYDNVSLEGNFIPAYITGRFNDRISNPENYQIVVAVNDVVCAVTRPQTDHTGISRFSAIVAEELFREGKNEVAIFLANNTDGILHRARSKEKTMSTYSLTADNQLISPQGKALALSEEAFTGFLDRIEIQGEMVLFSGWAADLKNARIPDTIIIFANSKFIYSGPCNSSREDVAKHYKDPSLQTSGFRYILPLKEFKQIEPSAIRVFAASEDGPASELVVQKKP